MNLINRVEKRIILPNDTETERLRKRVAAVVLASIAVLTVLNGLRVYDAGLDELGTLYYTMAAFVALALLIFLVSPRTYIVVAVTANLIALVTNLLAHLLTGGYTSGLWAFAWVLLVPVMAPLFVRQRLVVLLVVAFTLTVIFAGYFEVQARANLPELGASFVAVEASSNLIVLGIIVASASLFLFNQVERYRQRADDLLLNILPLPIAQRLKERHQTIADGYEDVTVLFADIVGFTALSSVADPADVVNKLNEIFSDFDRLTARHGLEKIKTIGDAYMVAGGVPQPRNDHCQAVVAFAFDLLAVMERHTSWHGEPMGLRIGINSGSVVAGVIGEQKFIYDLWGDTVNVASRMESSGLANEIQVTQAVKDCLGSAYQFEQREPITIKGKGEMITYLLRPYTSASSRSAEHP